MKNRDYPTRGSMINSYAHHAPISFNSCGYLVAGSIPRKCIADCSASGDVSSSVAYWRDRLSLVSALSGHRTKVERYLSEFGAWDDLTDTTMETLADRVLWSACCDIAENGEWYGICH